MDLHNQNLWDIKPNKTEADSLTGRIITICCRSYGHLHYLLSKTVLIPCLFCQGLLAELYDVLLSTTFVASIVFCGTSCPNRHTPAQGFFGKYMANRLKLQENRYYYRGPIEVAACILKKTLPMICLIT